MRAKCPRTRRPTVSLHYLRAHWTGQWPAPPPGGPPSITNKSTDVAAGPGHAVPVSQGELGTPAVPVTGSMSHLSSASCVGGLDPPRLCHLQGNLDPARRGRPGSRELLRHKPGAGRSLGGGRPSLEPWRKRGPAHTRIPPSGLQNCAARNFCCRSHPVSGACDSRPSTLTQEADVSCLLFTDGEIEAVRRSCPRCDWYEAEWGTSSALVHQRPQGLGRREPADFICGFLNLPNGPRKRSSGTPSR